MSQADHMSLQANNHNFQKNFFGGIGGLQLQEIKLNYFSRNIHLDSREIFERNIQIFTI